MVDFLIEKDVPIPFGRNTERFPALEKLEVGDSYQIELLPGDDISRYRIAARKAAVRRNIQITIRKFGDGYRCWRTE